MEKSLYKFIWKYSKRDQLLLLGVTLLTFPILYVSLELPKRIINDAISGSGENVTVLGLSLGQIEFLFLLCVGFLFAVLINGLLKMRLNTMKGVLAERLLRRFRYQLLTRVLRFPRPYFRTTSQGELVSMVTSESEPLGGLMGDMISQPVFQAGQMLTILGFLFVQSFWFGMASIALIPLQAWIIPRLQRQINLLNKRRIEEIRLLAAEIGETAQGVSDIRINGGLRYRMALFSNRLGNLFGIRFQIYQKKFFMKFLNNFINQLTPFFFYAVGGYLAIQGEITVGALVAALAAYKDLSSPWKELLTYYNLTQDMALRWDIINERFAPKTLAKDSLFDGVPETIPSLAGDIEVKDVTVRDEKGQVILEDINLKIPQGARVAIQTNSEDVAAALGDLFTREVIPHRGTVHIAGHDLNELHQVVIASRIGYAHSNAHLFKGTVGENLLMPFKQEPESQEPESNAENKADKLGRQKESARAGNSTDPFDVNWVAPKMGDFNSPDEIGDWWFHLIETTGTDDLLVRRALRSRLVPGAQPELEKAIVGLRPEIAKRLSEAGLDDVLFPFDPDKFNPVSPLGSNLLYALPTRAITQEALSKEPSFMRILGKLEIEENITQISVSLIEGLIATFGNDGTNHPLFRRLNMEDGLYDRLGQIMAKRQEVGDAGLPPDDFALMLTVPFAFSAEQIGPIFTDEFKKRVLEIRSKNAAELVEELDGLFETIDPDRYIPVMTVLGNAIFGRISGMAGAREKMIEDIVVDILGEHGLRRLAAQSIYDLTTVHGGENLPTLFRERAAFSRAGIKRPDILVLNNELASFDKDTRAKTHERISRLMPNTTKIFIESQFFAPDSYDVHVQIKGSRIASEVFAADSKDADARDDLGKKVAMIAQTALFANLDLRQQRLLGFSSQWYEAKAGQAIFKRGEEADAAYLCVSGRSGLYWPIPNREGRLVSDVRPGRLIGDLAVITKDPRMLDLLAIEDSVFLRIGANELLSVIENDAMVAAALLKSVAGHLTDAGKNIGEIRRYAAERGVDFSDFKGDF